MPRPARLKRGQRRRFEDRILDENGKNGSNLTLGKTHKIEVGKVDVYVTVNCFEDGNPGEVFVKCTDGTQGWCNVLSETLSVALQSGAPLNTLLQHWKHHRFPPNSFRYRSIPDAVAHCLEENYLGKEATPESSDNGMAS